MTTADTSVSPADELFITAAMDSPVSFAVPGGEVAVFSRGSPDKDTPNEDCAAVLSVHDTMTVLVVADGLGGSREGKEASAAVVQTLRESLAQATRERASPRSAILNGLEQANRDILTRGTGSATTVVVAAISGDFLRVYHVGDSGLLQLGQRGRLVHQTVAHSPVGFAQASGMLSEEEALFHEERHYVSNSLGTTQMSIEVGPALQLNRRDTVLLASDGLLDNLRLDEIIERTRAGQLADCAERLQSTACHRMATPESAQPSKADDLTFVLYRRTE
ncbi:MAG: PP2C family serine/threonine-protein phosphatase [Gammaproteobacteria bacterium]